MFLPFRRRLLQPRTRTSPFSPTADGGGLYIFDEYDNDLPRDAFELMIRVWWASTSAQDIVELQFANIDPVTGFAGESGTDRMLILYDDSGALSSFVEDNLGQWWIVPRDRDHPRQFQRLMFRTTGSDNVNTLNVEIAWVPRFPCSLHDLLKTMNYEIGPVRLDGQG